MSLKKGLSDRMVKELYQVTSSEHFARLSAVLWRLLNEWQRTKGPPGDRMAVLEARLEQLEQKAGGLATKLAGLEELLGRGGKTS
jgi:hypothetical protein